MQRMLGDDFARRMNIPLADIVYLQQRPVTLMPRRLHRRWHRLRQQHVARLGDARLHGHDAAGRRAR
ncbi:hypothetical protein [Georgenia sp. H159]|uniref:hypothetical protein n=1 Tax=Georgenia sp. H159 TaxID=3076115 RepID=UPI002D783BFE|nr:hypothetical protein [Georgenia sp. H159]